MRLGRQDLELRLENSEGTDGEEQLCSNVRAKAMESGDCAS